MLKNKVKNFLFSELILGASSTKRIAYVGVMTAFSIAFNMLLEFRMFDVQFSLTIAISVLLGWLLGTVFGFTACMLGDFIGYIVNSWGQLYMPWVGLSTGIIAVIAGIIFNGIRFKYKGELILKIILVCILSFFICTVGINSTGFYFYNKTMGFSTVVVNYVTEHFGGKVSYFAYLAYRLIFKGQILNNLFNYAVLFVVLPLLNRFKFIEKNR